MLKDNLAILGGPKTRTKPFILEPLINNREKELILAAIDEMNFSRYIGSKPSNFEEILTLNSNQAKDIESDWHFLGGPNIRNFCANFANKFKVDFAIPVNSATSGLSTAVAALGLNGGDEIIVPGLSYTASGTAPVLFNAIPKFVDVNHDTFCIDPLSIRNAITKRTKAIMCVHLLGNMCEMDEILQIAFENNLKVIEDVAQAPGSKYKGKYAGTIGDLGVFSFQQSKNIMTGEGGMIITKDKELAKKCRLIINHGEVCFDESATDEELVNIIGCNFRMTELTAAIGIAQLEKLDEVNNIRNSNAIYLMNLMEEFKFLNPPIVHEYVEPIFHILSFKFNSHKIGISRDLFLAALRAEGIPVGTGYVRGMYRNPIFIKKIAYGKDNYPWNLGKTSQVSNFNKEYKNIENLINNEFVWFYQIANSSKKEDMEDISIAIRKIVKNLDELKNNESQILGNVDTSLKQGRI